MARRARRPDHDSISLGAIQALVQSEKQRNQNYARDRCMRAADAADSRELAAILQRLEAAENAGDAETIIDSITDDAVIMVPDQPVMEGKTVCAEFLRGMLRWMLESLDRHITYV